MGEKEHIIERLKQFLKKLNKNMSIERICLFGSRAWGKPHRYSDIDLIIVSKDFEGLNFFERCYKMYDYWTLDYPVDFLCYTPEEFNKLKKKITIVKEAVRKGIEIKQANKKIIKIKKRIVPLLKKKKVIKAGIFGSYACGEEKKNSDIDILIEVKEKKFSLLDLVDLEMKLKKLLKKEVELMTYGGLSPYLKKRIMQEEIRII